MTAGENSEILYKMCYWWMFISMLVFVVAKPSERDECGPKCKGIEYECINGSCYCAEGFIQNYFLTGCVRCPNLGERCFGTCCSHTNSSLQCWHGVCQPCYDVYGNWACRDTVDQLLLISTTQVIMGTALALGLVATLVLLFKLCTTTQLRSLRDKQKRLEEEKRIEHVWKSILVRPLGSRNNVDSRLSIGSLQLYVEERLRDAPPRYTRPSSATAAIISTAYQNDGFIHDVTTVPPPPYTEVKNETQPNPSVHI